MNTLHSQMRADMVLRGLSPRTQQHYRGAAKRCRSDQTTQISFSSRWGREARRVGCQVERLQAFGGGELEEFSHRPPGR